MVYLGLAEEDEGYIDDDYEAEEPVREPVAARPARRAEQREMRDLREREVRVPEMSPPRRSRHEIAAGPRGRAGARERRSAAGRSDDPRVA